MFPSLCGFLLFVRRTVSTRHLSKQREYVPLSNNTDLMQHYLNSVTKVKYIRADRRELIQ